VPFCSSILVVVLGSAEAATIASRSSAARHRRRYDSIFSFGNSFADTANNPAVFAWYGVSDPNTRPPYGSTFFGRAQLRRQARPRLRRYVLTPRLRGLRQQPHTFRITTRRHERARHRRRFFVSFECMHACT